MKILNLLLILILNISSPFFSIYAIEDNDSSQISVKFESYPAVKKSFKKAKTIDFNSYKDANKSEKILNKGFKKGPNFAQYLIVVEEECGSDQGCGSISDSQHQWIIDSRTGKIIERFETDVSAKFQLDSTLLILNPFSNEDLKVHNDDTATAEAGLGPIKVDVIYQVFDGKNFKIIKKETIQ